MILITTHVNADLDGFGSMVGLRRLYPDATLSLPGSQEKCVRLLLQELDVETYGIVPPKAVPLDQVTRLVLADTKRPERLGCFEPLARRDDLPIDLYDHHPPAAGDIVSAQDHNRAMGSNSAMVAGLLMAKGIEPTAEEATLLTMGIFEDTGNLTFPSVTADDVEALAWLVRLGADLPRAGRQAARNFKSGQIQLFGRLLEGIERLHLEGLHIGIANAHTEEYVDDLAVIAHRLTDMEKFDALFVLVDMGGRLYLVARSAVPDLLDVGVLMTNFGGGGHRTAAFACIREKLIPQTLAELRALLAASLENPLTAREIMTSPVRCVGQEMPIDDARRQLTRYTLKAMPVLADGQMVGVITRNILEKAAAHGLAGAPVEEFMITDYRELPLEAPITRIKELILDQRQILVPVIHDGRLRGCITRTDLFRTLEERYVGLPPSPGGQEKSGGGKKNFKHLMGQRLPKSVMARLAALGVTAHQHGMTAYLVGGMVRDLLLDRANIDVDIVVEGGKGDAIELARAVAETTGAPMKFHKAFRTATLTFPGEDPEGGDLKVDVATTRHEYYERPAALPVVEPGSIKADLARRDFTINTMAINLSPDKFGQLIDYFGARRDLRDKAIRVLHNLSFVEDPTRIFRAVRFELTLGFKTGKHTQKLINSAVRMDFLMNLSGKRLFSELRQLLDGPEPIKSISRLAQLDVLRFIHPKLVWNQDMRKLFVGVRETLAWLKISNPQTPDEEPLNAWETYLSALIYNIPSAEAERLLTGFNLPMKRTGRIVKNLDGVHAALSFFHHNPVERALPWETYRRLIPLTREGILLLMARTDNPDARQAASRHLEERPGLEPRVGGADLGALGLTPGPHFRAILEAVRRHAVETGARNREAQLAFLEENRNLWFTWEEEITPQTMRFDPRDAPAEMPPKTT